MDGMKMFFTEHSKLVGIAGIVLGVVFTGIAVFSFIVSGFTIPVLIGGVTGIVILLFGALVAVKGVN